MRRHGRADGAGILAPALGDAPALQAASLGRVYVGAQEVHAVRDFDLTVACGEMVAVMGPSGSGKTTLLQLLGGLDAPTSGTVKVMGRDISSASRSDRARIRRREVGYVFQDSNLVPSLTAVENVSLPMELDGVRRRRTRELAQRALADVGLEGLDDRLPDQLSGGQQQRVAIARALIGNRTILLADEPTGELDTAASRDVMALLRSRVDRGAAAVVVTHDPLCAAYADRVVYVVDGAQADALEADDPALLLGGPRFLGVPR